ncbi:MAG TPA: hypothetical protein VJ697_13315 [Nitrososphaeraceae archaeon]|nr:hypothetical protein [Nitrososphaeraceae archaeon]
MNISNANAIADFDNKIDRKQQAISMDCSNYNVNVNGLELDVFPPFLADNSGLATEAAAAEAEDGNTDPRSIASGNNGDTSEIKDFRVICTSYNDNRNIQAGEKAILPEPLTPPVPEPDPKSTLTVKKSIICNDPGIDRCIMFQFRDIGKPANYNYQVTGNNPQPNTFTGSAIDFFQSQNDVTIGPGPYTITETFPAPPISLTLTTTFSGSCKADPDVPQKATGNIVAGIDQTCEIINTYTPSGR